MKELIGKLSRGVIEYDSPIVETSVSEISKEINDTGKVEGAFSVFCENDSKLKGIVYSTSEKVVLINDKFTGRSSIIKYVVDTGNCESGSVIHGSFNVVTNGGEVVIPYDFTVRSCIIESSDGEVTNLFHFTNLVKSKYEEAVRIFTDEKFSKCLLKDNLQYQALYEGLIKSRSRDNALEEFLIGINKKQRIEFSVSDRSREYDSLENDYGDIILISKDGWGYAEINVETEGDFIADCKKRITTEDFAGNNYEYRFSIKISGLHDGLNYGRIIFKTPFQKIEVNISVDNIHGHDLAYLEKKLCSAKLSKMYLDFRMRKISVNEWAEDSLKAIERVRGFDDSSNFIKLVQAQIYLSRSMDEQAGWLLGNVAEEILDERESNVELYAYYLYVRTLQKRNPDMTADVLRKVKHYYENGYDSWKLLWILLYLDNSYESNKSLKIARIKEQYNKGCRSPLMYFEALNAFARQPVLLRMINDFELQVLVFGCRYEGINLRLAMQISELAMVEKQFRPLLFYVLTNLYRRFGEREILTAICSLLIRGNKTDSRYFEWYRLGIEADIKLARLYEYYIFSMDDNEEVVFPEKLLMYFANNSQVLMEKQEVLYANIIENRENIPAIYKNYEDIIEKFALEQIMKGNMNEHLSVIYRDILRESMIDTDMGKHLVGIMNTYKVQCFNEDISEVVVIHKEIEGEERYPVRNGKAYIRIFTEEPAVIFIDRAGNRYYKTINYTLKQIYQGQEYMNLCAQMDIDDIYLMANTAEKLLKYHNESLKSINLFKRIMEYDNYRINYKLFIMKDVIDFYYNNYDGDELDDYLRSINRDYLNSDTETKVIELMLLRGLDKEASEHMMYAGIGKISPGRLVKYCTRRFLDNDFMQDEQLLNICIYAFKNGKYSESVLKYLCKYYNGTTKEMLDIWRACREFEYSDREYEERLLAQMLFTRTQLSSITDVYDSYYINGPSEKIKKAFLFYESYSYLVKETPVSAKVFKYLGMELEKGDTLNRLCEAAYVKYYSEASASDDELLLCERLIKNLVSNEIVFDFYKKYSEKIELPYVINENAVLEYRTKPESRVHIHYIITDNNEASQEYQSEEMTEVFPGIYTKKIMLFYGENLMYYITEEDGDNKSLTESRNYYIESGISDGDGTRYSRINEILVCREMQEDSTMREMMKSYYIENMMVQKLF